MGPGDASRQKFVNCVTQLVVVRHKTEYLCAYVHIGPALRIHQSFQLRRPIRGVAIITSPDARVNTYADAFPLDGTVQAGFEAE